MAMRWGGLLALIVACASTASAQEMPHNVILVVPAGLRALSVTRQAAPSMAELRDHGAFFADGHALVPADAVANGEAMLTGRVPDSAAAASILAAARDAGYGTALIGAPDGMAPADYGAHGTVRTLVVDARSGRSGGRPIAGWAAEALMNAGLAVVAPAERPARLRWFLDAAVRAALPQLAADRVPFLLVLSLAGAEGAGNPLADAEEAVSRIRHAVETLRLAESTDIIVAAAHGAAVAAKESRTSAAARAHYDDVPEGELPPGFLAIDLARALGLPLRDPDAEDALVAPGTHPVRGNGRLGPEPDRPLVEVEARGGADLVRLAEPVPKGLAGRIVEALLAEDYIAGLFVDPTLGHPPGTLPADVAPIVGTGGGPAILVAFRDRPGDCEEPTNCAATIADTPRAAGKEVGGGLGRAESEDFIAAIGPDFKGGYIDPVPASTADIGRTIAQILKLDALSWGKGAGRVLREALIGGAEPHVVAKRVESAPAAGGLRTAVRLQAVEGTLYVDAAGMPGRTLGLERPGWKPR